LRGLPSLVNAKLPANYQAAKKAIAECARLDECKSWKDKAAALASYAKQADDKELENMSRRILARAYDRMKELLAAIPPKGGKAAKGSVVNDTTPSRTQIAREAGLSHRQQVTAMRVGNVPRALFEEQVESDHPPTIAELARQGTRRIDTLKGRDEADFKAATKVLGLLTYAIEKIPNLDIPSAVLGMNVAERKRALKNAAELREWVSKLIKNLER
jgi:hypothetical protein